MDDLEPLDPLDELASAYLDDEATPAERARVEADQDLLVRVSELRRARMALQAMSPIDPVERDATLEAALAEFDLGALYAATGSSESDEPRPDHEPGDATAAAGAAARGASAPVAAVRVTPVDQIAAKRVERAGRRDLARRFVPWLAAAAAIGAIGLVIPRLGSSSNDSSSSSATTAGAAADAAAAVTTAAGLPEINGPAEVESKQAADTAAGADTTAAASETTAAAAGGAAAESTASDIPLAASLPVPSFDDRSGLVTYVRSLVAAGRTTSATSAPFAATDLCPADAPPAPGTIAGPAVWQGEAAVLVLVPDASAPMEVVVLAADCATVLERAGLG